VWRKESDESAKVQRCGDHVRGEWAKENETEKERAMGRAVNESERVR
jgi:hypothetical protein